MGIKVDTHFTELEMNCRCGCGKPSQPVLILKLESLRNQLRIPLNINSGARCKGHNKLTGGTPDSWHLKGMAADIQCFDANFRSKLIRTAALVGFNGIGISEKFVHLDLRDESFQVFFLY